MSKTIFCTECHADREFNLIHEMDTVPFRGKDVPYEAEFFRCSVCGNEFETMAQMDANLDAAREAYDRLFATPSPVELIALREKYGASQKAFGLLLGLGEATMNTYEKGISIPNSSNRLLLSIANDPHAFQLMYEKNKHKIGDLQRTRIEASSGYQEAQRWAGLSALANELTQVQMDKIVHCADQHHLTVPQQVLAYVTQASFRDYSGLMTSATWSKPVLTQAVGSRITDVEMSKLESIEASA